MRLLLTIVILLGAAAYLWGTKDRNEEPNILQQEQVKKAKALEQQLQDDLKKRMEEADRKSG